ncbi:MAG TPA: DUF1707 and FHA domain-containing protein [Acidothermaceae bacterium]|nr:DUF1707 and FHA domain-containing protein [Acidothermaceae bacterium]
MTRVPALAQRASDRDRERAIALLRDASVVGRLSHNTFVGRVDRALVARDRAELAHLVRDISPRRGIVDWVESAVSAVSDFARQVAGAWRSPRLPTLRLPSRGPDALTIGRASDQDFLIAHTSVSRHHALLRCSSFGWELVDLGSTNGTRVNGWRVAVPEVIRAGDVVTFGAVAMLVVDPSASRPHDRRFS